MLIFYVKQNAKKSRQSGFAKSQAVEMKNRLKDLVILKTKKEIKRRGHQWEF